MAGKNKKNSSEKRKFVQVVMFFSPNLRQFTKIQNYHILQLDIAAELGYDVELFIHRYDRKYSNSELSIGKNVKVFYYKGLFQYLKYLFKNRDSVIYANGRNWQCYLCAFFGKPNIFMNHDSVVLRTRWKQLINNFFENRFKYVRVINEEEKKILLSYGMKKDKIQVIPLAVDYGLFSSKIKKKNELREKYKIPLNSKVVLFLSNTHPDKDPYTVLDAFKRVLDKDKNAFLLLTGEDRMTKTKNIPLTKYADSIGIPKEKLKGLGYQPQKVLPEIYALSDLYVLSSVSEGQCLTVFEAASAGLPLCLSKTTSFYPLFRKGALFHKVGDHQKLSENILKLLNNKKMCERFVKNNTSMIKKDYNYRVIRNKLRSFLKKFIKEKNN